MLKSANLYNIHVDIININAFTNNNMPIFLTKKKKKKRGEKEKCNQEELITDRMQTIATCRKGQS